MEQGPRLVQGLQGHPQVPLVDRSSLMHTVGEVGSMPVTTLESE